MDRQLQDGIRRWGHTMKKRGMTWLSLLLPIAIGWSLPGSPSAETTPVKMVVSVEAKHGGDVPTISREDVRVLQGGTRLQVVNWAPLQGDRAGLELYVLIDDAADVSLSKQFDGLRQFLNAQPPTTSIAVGYIGFGMVDVIQTFTKNHSQAAKALRLPMGVGGGMTGPYGSIETLIKKWPENSARREVLIVTSGTGAESEGPNSPYLLSAIEQAQRAGVQVHVIDAVSEGQLGIIRAGSNLEQLAKATGGNAYFQGSPMSCSPFFDDIANQLKHQYQLTFLATAGPKAGYHSVRLETEVRNAELVAADKVFVPAAK
jgi:hypothetical protein